MGYKTAKQLVEKLEKDREKMLNFALWFHDNIYYSIPEENLYYFNDSECYTKDDLFNEYEDYTLGFS